MKPVHWTDENGYKHLSFLRDDDPDELAPSRLLQDPPDVVHEINWDAVQRELHNQLVNRGLFSWDDVQRSKDGITGAVLACLRRRVIELYNNRRKADG